MSFKDLVTSTELDEVVAILAREFMDHADRHRLDGIDRQQPDYSRKLRESNARVEAYRFELGNIWRAARARDAITLRLLKTFAEMHGKVAPEAAERMLQACKWLGEPGRQEYTVTVQGERERYVYPFHDRKEFLEYLRENCRYVLSYGIPDDDELGREAREILAGN